MPLAQRATGKGGEPGRCREPDVNGDRLAGLVCEIDSTRLAIDDGPTELRLEAVMTSALAVAGTDAVSGGGYDRPGAVRNQANSALVLSDSTTAHRSEASSARQRHGSLILNKLERVIPPGRAGNIDDDIDRSRRFVCLLDFPRP